MIISSIIFLVLGIIFLVKGSGIFVGSASHIAKKLGVSDFIIGLTLVALGTSLPELVSSIFASIQKQSGLVIGTIIGANIANLTLIIGIAALLSKIKVEKEVLKRDGYILMFVILLLLLFLYDGTISRIEGIVFLLLYISYTFFLMETRSKIKREYNFADFAKYFIKFGYLAYLKRGLFLKIPKKKNNKKIVRNHLSKYYLILMLGLVLVYFSAKIVVDKAIIIANYFSIAPIVIGVLISIGTTLPELSVAISASTKKYGNVAIGNSIGSCITNTLLILGVSAIIHPLQILKGNVFMTYPFLIVSTILVLLFIKTDLEVSRRESIMLLIVYLLFIVKIAFF